MKPYLFEALKNYKKTDLPRDLLAGLMVAIVALPLSIALGIQSVPEQVSKNGVQMGIVTAIVAGFFISALGGSKYQIGGPTAAFVTILFAYLSKPQIGIVGLAIAGIMAGIILIIMGICRAGNVLKYFPYPIIIGFTTGIGITLMIGQIKDFCGFTATGSETIHKIISYIESIGSFNPATFAVGFVGLAIVILLPKLSKKIPSALVALIVCTLLSSVLNSFCGTNIATIGSKYGEITAGFSVPDFSQTINIGFLELIQPAIVIALLCAIESLLSASVAAGLTNTSINPNQELIGQGVANICSSIVGGLPATGAIARTVTGIENGAKSPLTGVFHALFVLVMYFALMNVVKFIPLAVFAAILTSVAINMSRFPLFVKLLKVGRRDVCVLLLSCILTVLTDLTFGVLGGIVLAFLLNIPNMRTKLVIEQTTGSGEICVSGNLFFLNANTLTDRLEKELSERDGITVDMKNVSSIDSTAIEKLSKLNRKCKATGKTLSLIGYNETVGERLNMFFGVI